MFPHDEPLAGRTEEAGGKRGPMHAELEAAGCVHQERLGWERPGEVFFILQKNTFWREREVG